MKKSIIFFCFFLLTATVKSYAAPTHNDYELVKTIILINGTPFLVEMDANGTVLHNYLLVKNYFDSNDTHESLVAKASKEYDDEIEMLNNSRLVIFNEESSLLNDVAVDHIRDLADKYSRGVLQNINITAGRTTQNNDTIMATYRVDAIAQLLQDFGVAEGDISRDIKIYRSELPNQFVKIDLLK